MTEARGWEKGSAVWKVPGYPKICALGQRPVEHIFNSEVEITEKLDGSSFAFGVFDGDMYTRSKGVQQSPYEMPENDMFYTAVQEVLFRQRLGIFSGLEDIWFYGEYLRKPKHNTLHYDRVPQGHIALFAAHHPDSGLWWRYADLHELADKLELGVVKRVMCEGTYEAEDILNFLATDPVSALGGPMEGVVIKNFNEDMEYVGKYSPFTVAKFVTEKFKEVHDKTWKAENTTGGAWSAYKERYRTPQRWHKSVQHLRDNGELLLDPSDIGRLIIEVQKDVGSECKEEIKTFLWKHYGKELLRHTTRGLPEWYKEQLALGEVE